MMIIFRIILFASTVLVGVVVINVLYLVNLFRVPEHRSIPETWWGSGDPLQEDKTIYPFKINVSQEVLDDLQYRLEHTRLFAKPLEDNQKYGFNGELAQEILDHWKTKYDWRQREKYLNKYPQFITSIQGLKIHFLHVKPSNISQNTKVLPLLIAHGWPGSVREFYEIIPKLVTPRKDSNFAFEVIAPHLPGYVFSEASSKPGLGAIEIASIFKNLMYRLGFKKFYIQGGDLGSIVLQSLSIYHEDAVLGFHSNMCVSFQPYSIIKIFLGSLYPSWIGKKSHQDLFYPLTKLLPFLLTEFGYLHIQATKPDSLGISMDDSPMGLAAYNLEKFSTGSHFDFRFRKDGGLKEKFTYDGLLDNIMLYWINKSVTTSFRLYAEIFNLRQFTKIFWLPVKVPVACARFQNDVLSPDGIIHDTFHNLVQVSDYDGGHFAAFEDPRLLADDIFSGISKIENIYAKNQTCDPYKEVVS